MNIINSKKSIILLGILLLAILFLFPVFVSRNYRYKPQALLPTPTINQYAISPIQFTSSILSMVKVDNVNMVNVILDTGTKPVSAVQLEISYDPNILSNVLVSQGDFLKNAIVLSNAIDRKNGIIFYALAVKSGSDAKSGQGVIATISYSPNLGIVSSTNLQFLTNTKVTTQGIENSILKKSNNLNLSF